MTKTHHLYEIFNVITNERYVGVTTMILRARWASHLWKLRNNKHNDKFQAAFNKYGEHCFNIKLLYSGGKEEVYAKDVRGKQDNY